MGTAPVAYCGSENVRMSEEPDARRSHAGVCVGGGTLGNRRPPPMMDKILA